jgi:nitroimidazol reductase NimA-like FMN-containing flavoprotein (pyridoxamine 5'-phosphate oxidase superfamily)
MTEPRQRRDLPREECLRLLGEVPVGRVVFTQRALPAVRAVSHLVEDDQIVFRADLGTVISSEASGDRGTVVAYEADLIDAAESLGWSVVVVGRAAHVTDEAEAARYRRALPSWATGGDDDIIALRAGIVAGFRLEPAPAPGLEAAPRTGARPAAGPVAGPR